MDVALEGAPSLVQPRRPKLYEAGLFLVVVVVPIAFLPISSSPFADLKLVALALGVMLLWASAPPVERTIAILAGCWFGVSVLASIFGVDPGRSLTGNENAPAGLALVLASAYLVSVGAAMPREYRERLPRWLASTASVVAALVVLWRIAPGIFSFMPRLQLTGSTLGSGPFMAAFLALGLVALAPLRLPMWRSIAGAALFGLALGGTPHRLALVSTAIGFVFSVWHCDAPRRAVAAIGITALLAFLLWGLWPAQDLVSPGASAPALEQTFTGKPPDSRRLSVLVAVVKATETRPILGWGPGNTLSSWLTGAQPGNFPRDESFADAHNIFIEQLSATGFVGVLAFLALVGTLARRMLRRPRPTGWLAGAVVVLVLLHLFEPLNVAMTSLGFLILGVAVSRDGAAAAEPFAKWRPTRIATGALLFGMVVISLLTLTSSVLEQYEKTYFTPDHGGLRIAAMITPWRIASTADLAIQLAADGRSGNQARGVEARQLVQQMLQEHPEYPPAYLDALLVYELLMDPKGAAPVLDQFKQRFPLAPQPVFTLGPGGSAGPGA